MNVEQARFNMIEQQIRPWDVRDDGVLSLLSIVKREDFVPLAYRALAFVDAEVPLPEGQCMLAPRVEARLLQEMQVHKHENVLEIGSGSGFMAALLGHRARSVLSLEIRPNLLKLAADNLKRAGQSNISLRLGDGSRPLRTESGFDAILLSGSVSAVPPALLEALQPGGRLLAIVGQEPVMTAVRITRAADGSLRTEHLFDTVAPRLDGFGEPGQFRF